MLSDYIGRFDLDLKTEPLIPFCEGFTYAFLHFNDTERLREYAAQLLQHEYARAVLMDQASKMEKDNPRDFKKLLYVYGATEYSDDIYLLYLHRLYADEVGDMEALEAVYSQIFTRVVDFFDMDEAIWAVAKRRGIELVSYMR